MKIDGSLNTVCFVPSDKMGCGYYRAALPCIGLCRQGYPAHLLTKDRIQLYKTASTLVFQGQNDENIIDFIMDAKSQGIKIVYDLDDNVFCIPKYNPAYSYWTSARQDNVKRIMELCDTVTTTTPFLANVFKNYNKNVVIVPNAVLDDLSMNATPSLLECEDNVIIGWIGAAFHKQDLLLFNDLIPKLMNKYKKLKFLTMGAPPPKDMDIYGNRIIKYPYVEPIVYHKVLSNLSMYIGLAPLVANDFNKSKSPVKVLEYLYMNTLPICSDIEPYQDLCRDKDFGYVVPTKEEYPGNVDDWMDIIDLSLNKIEEVEDKIADGNQYIKDNYSIECDTILNVYKSVYGLDKDV